ncbi:FIST C-terminal domain-containing protein [Patescibacteria group bacterium]|nr:FIST C-terminal domain-containing protein [Patescibacteria group bacterium]
MFKPKLIIGFLVVILLVGVAAYSLFILGVEEKTKAVHGHSVKDTEIEAVAEAVSMIKRGVSDPDYVLLFSTAGYDSETVLKEVNRLLPHTKIYGSTSMLSVITKDGWHEGAKGSLGMMAISSPKITFGVGGANIDDYTSAKEAGSAAIQNAIKNAEKEGSYPQLVLMTSAPGNEEKIIEGIEDVIGWGIPIIGGSSGDNDLTGQWKQFVNHKVYSNGVSLTAVFTDLKIGYAYEAGYERSEAQGTITKAEGRVINEIDNKPAAEIYNEWCDGCVAEKLETGGPILSESTFWPLAKMIDTVTGIYYLSIHPLSIDAGDKSLTVFANVMEGDKILLMRGGWQLLLDRAKQTPQKALLSEEIVIGEPIFGIYTYCAGTMLGIPPEERVKIPSLVSEAIGKDVPFIGTFTFGEQGPLGLVNHHGNLINSMIVFSE